jgi:hypothetical protein
VTVSAGLLEGFALELAYGLVGTTSLEWVPAVDELLTLYCEERLRSVAHGGSQWTNRGARHSLRVSSRDGLDGLAAATELFGAENKALAELAAKLDARLLPSGMHPWMAATRAERWPHGKDVAEDALDSLFGLDRHGFCNQQALRLSIPFASDFEFARLFGALRFVMPLLPTLSASSPFAEGERGPAMSCRVAARRDYFSTDLDFADTLVPKPSTCSDQYRSEVVTPLSKAISQRGLSKALAPLALCANGIVADFDAGLVHIEILDMQECLQANIAVCGAVAALTIFVQNEEYASLKELSHWPRARLGELFEESLVEGPEAVFRDRDFIEALGFPERGSCLASELWQHLFEEKLSESPHVEPSAVALKKIASEGSLATRLLRALPQRWNDEDLFYLYRKVAECMDRDELF